MEKSRLAPLKPVTIPRMELSAAVLSTRLDTMFREELEFTVDESIYWTDSTCVLRYVENEDKRYQTEYLQFAGDLPRYSGGMLKQSLIQLTTFQEE